MLSKPIRMKKLHLLVFFSFFCVLLSAQNDNKKNSDFAIEKQISEAIIAEYQSQLTGFEHALSAMLNGNEEAINMYFFSDDEAQSFSWQLQNSNYPDASQSLADEILMRNQKIRDIFSTLRNQYSSVQLVHVTHKIGHTEQVQGFLTVLTFQNIEKNTAESISILLVITDNKLKILSTKDEQ